MRAYDLNEIYRKAYNERKILKIVRVDKLGKPASSFRFSVNINADSNIFSVNDINSYWYILEEEIPDEPSPKKST